MNSRRIGLAITIVAISLFAQSSNTVAEKEAVSEKAEVQKAAVNRDDEVVCRMVKATGSNIKRKVCKTRSQRAADVTKSQQTMDEMRRSTRAIGN
jgi:hypothetical protein